MLTAEQVGAAIDDIALEHTGRLFPPPKRAEWVRVVMEIAVDGSHRSKRRRITKKLERRDGRYHHPARLGGPPRDLGT